MKQLKTNVLILGGGGLFAALRAHSAAPDLSITVAVKGLLGKTGRTRMLQGGYNVALAAGDLGTSSFTRVRLDGGKMAVDTEPARFTLVSPGESLIKDNHA